MKPNTDNTFNRREFLIRSAKAGAMLAGIGGAAAIMYDADGPSGAPKPSGITALRDYAVPAVDGKTMAVVKGGDRSRSLNTALSLLGGIERFVRKGDIVAIKPNIAFASAPELGATSHPEIVAALVRRCRDAGAKRVLVFDNPINDPASCYFLSGIEAAVVAAGGEMLLPRPDQFVSVNLAGASLIRNWPLLYGPLAMADRLIGVAPVKSHSRSVASLSIKNWYGLLGGRRNIFHQDIHALITELSRLVRPTLVVLDGMQVMQHNGPTGGSLSDLVSKNTLIASTDPVAADAYAATLLGLSVDDVPFIGMAGRAGSGNPDFTAVRPITAEAG